MPTKKQLQEQNRDFKVDLTKAALIMAEFDRLIDLIKEADTEEKINPLKELDHLE